MFIAQNEEIGPTLRDARTACMSGLEADVVEGRSREGTDAGLRAAVFAYAGTTAESCGGLFIMKWQVHYIDRGTGLNIWSRDLASRDQALILACAFLRAGHELQNTTCSSGETIDRAEVKEWCQKNSDKLTR